MNSRDFIAVSRDLLAAARTGKLTQVRLRRAVSTAYYAVFHEICKMCADELVVSQTRNQKMTRAWRHVYRGLNHRKAKAACKKIEDNESKYNFPEELRNLGLNFSTLQEERHRADYDPSMRFKPADVEQLIDRAEKAIQEVVGVKAIHKKTFAAFLLLPERD